MNATDPRRLLARLLHLANSDPHYYHRAEFYALKERLLRRYGRLTGYAIQSFPGQVCFRCNGSGEDPWDYGDDDQAEPCDRCGGDGWWKRPVWVTLECWDLAGYPFHRPAGRVYERPEILDRPTRAAREIQGHIEHRRYSYYLSREAFYWLALVYDRPLFWASWGHTAHLGRKRTPLVILGTWLFGVRRLQRVPARIGRWLREHRARREPATEAIDDFPF